VHYCYLVQISGFWEQLGQNWNRNRIVKNSWISGHPEPDIGYIPIDCSEGLVSEMTCYDKQNVKLCSCTHVIAGMTFAMRHLLN